MNRPASVHTQRAELARRVLDGELARLPADIRDSARRCPVHLERRPPPPLDADLLGLFEGASLMEEPDTDPGGAPRITLYLDNLWDDADGDAEIFEEEVGITFLHELGHYLGWDEDQIQARGLE